MGNLMAGREGLCFSMLGAPRFQAGPQSLVGLLQLRRRAQIAQHFLSGEWGVELESYEADQERERLRAQEIAP